MAAADALPRVRVPELVDAAGQATAFDEAMHCSAHFETMAEQFPEQAPYAVAMA